MPLLSGMIRAYAITGRTDTVGAWCAGRQGGAWAEQTVRAAFHAEAPHAPTADPAESLRKLTELHQRGDVSDAEFETLRARLR